ncbi:MAG TPA: radical SAM protein [Spirochaetota bacterium]|nr:radical SAM protein [Spirochaetota bacterium]HPC39306.1 radical SAM protein [Spirochaetota bacterium]HPL15113.1 radical SAM protein [Spirochaetota bacterium]HQF08756.1 radical SAM protein [Spirochaetota bacterium]HQH97543.1 radical SAM protein [Spirochaetota bacterium]
MTPAYVELYNSGRLSRCAEELFERLRRCSLCPHRCGVNRVEGERGLCRSGIGPIVSSFNAHFGEESPLVGRCGSGTIFFTNCNLGCIFCQNYDISHLGRGEEVSYHRLAEMMVSLQGKGCHNINFVTPTHMNYAIVKALLEAVPMGLRVPLVYNSGGYDAVETLSILEGVYDIYMPDFKYMDQETAGRLSGAPDYPDAAMAAIREMHRQVGDLVMDRNGIARRGLLVRHLVLPNNIAATDRVINFIADLSPDTYINIMDQYRPEYRAGEWFDLKRRVTLKEYDDAVEHARASGLTRIDGLI